MIFTKEKTKKPVNTTGPNHEQKRKNAKWEAGKKMRDVKAKHARQLKQQEEMAAKDRKEKLEKITKRRETRDKIRKEIGKREGVNYKRVVLVGRVDYDKKELLPGSGFNIKK